MDKFIYFCGVDGGSGGGGGGGDCLVS